ncbi:PhoPQ-activated pathogenicity-related protein [Algoriphagus ratkowskyi]|uniref:PhoPQ-activated pathogenicity-like protein PqaA type n=1 Tax=Algoriphagus ratkowskyi TaxID=57028 RepID=A0A2W7RD79_9BACT|nr:PhoPQ-activated protein PqaA family protein [Algoriphagus ratkowskyi]PZX52139.1 PhoPQ-activated pathogenicity-related protein [Algoriphagus ratkowskyi]TXD76099.1 PhoPQ-activated pathogenicity-like protein PqaA type [Algoriphagus ratkowskyi]
MKSLSLRILLACYGILFFVACSAPAEKETQEAPTRSETLLKDYVNGPSPDFSYEIVHSVPGEKYDFHVLRMVSQNWLSTAEVNETEWWHWISVVVPKNTPFTTSLMWIGGGSTTTKMPEKPNELILAAAMQTNSIVAEIHNIPFQPVTFVNDPVGKRTEDGIIAYGWRKFLEGGAKDEDAIWLARFPMTKAVKLGMDAVTDAVEKNYQKKLDSFVVGGASKRGWTTWTTAATDDRVVAIIPVVIDMLNLDESFAHHWKNYGFWAPAVDDYVSEGIMDWMGTPEFDRLLEITDPYSFNADFDMPKLLINAASDQFFQPDSWEFYWNELIGEKHMQYVPNSGHNISESGALSNMIAFYASVLNESPRPKYDWKVEDEKITLTLDPADKPSTVKAWTAYNSETRDFRVDEFGPNWKAEEMKISESGTYELALEDPEKGYKAYFIEVTFAGKTPLKITSGIEVMPRSYPFPEYEPKRVLETVGN